MYEITQEKKIKAPELSVKQWFNTDEDLSLDTLKGKNVVLFAFQLLCPPCVSHSIPQMKKLAQLLVGEDTTIIGLHTVFEHHQAMNPDVLQAFLYENRINFPVAVDDHEPSSGVPMTMKAYEIQGTPSMVIINKEGYIEKHFFGGIEDLQLAYLLGKLS